jgi:DNA-binding transcriptional regulator GbsR (MarR family)
MLFTGLSPDEKAAAVLDHLAVDEEITIHELAARTGMTINQVHMGIRHLREATHCVITNRHGSASTYKLAENAPEVRDYAFTRMRHWQTQIGIIRAEMEVAQRLLPGAEAITVQKCAEIITSLLRILELDEAQEKELNRERQRLERQRRRPAPRTMLPSGVRT